MPLHSLSKESPYVFSQHIFRSHVPRLKVFESILSILQPQNQSQKCDIILTVSIKDMYKRRRESLFVQNKFIKSILSNEDIQALCEEHDHQSWKVIAKHLDMDRNGLVQAIEMRDNHERPTELLLNAWINNKLPESFHQLYATFLKDELSKALQKTSTPVLAQG